MFRNIAGATILAAAVWALAPGAALAVPAFDNASFEADNWLALAGPVTPSGWTATASGTYPRGADDAQGGSGPGTDYETPFGDQFVVIGSTFSGGGDSISQTVSGFDVGTWYELSAWISPDVSVDNSAGDYGHVIDLTLTDALAGETTERFQIGIGPTGTGTYNYWEQRTVVFQATSAALTFAFQGVAGNGIEYCGHSFCRDTGLDNLSLSETGAPETTAMPVPGSVALFGAGLIGLGLARRRRR